MCDLERRQFRLANVIKDPSALLWTFFLHAIILVNLYKLLVIFKGFVV